MRATAIRTEAGTLIAMVTVDAPDYFPAPSDSVALFKYDPEEPPHTDGGWQAIASVSAEPSSCPTAALVGRIRPEVLEVLERAVEALR